MKRSDTLFAQLVKTHNRNVGKTVHVDTYLLPLFKKGFITKNQDGSYYVASFNAYKSKLKKHGFMNCGGSSKFIEVVRKIPTKMKPKNL